MTLIYELPSATETLCRALSEGTMRRDPGARRIPGVSLSRLVIEKERRDAALRDGAFQRRVEWHQMSAAMAEHTNPKARLPVSGFSATKARNGGLPARRLDETSWSPASVVEPFPVQLPGWGEAA